MEYEIGSENNNDGSSASSLPWTYHNCRRSSELLTFGRKGIVVSDAAEKTT